METQSTPNPCRELLDPETAETLRALVDTLIPPDDYPGGWEGGVGNYLARGFAHQLAPVLPTYRAALAALDAEARALPEALSFATLPDTARIALLERLETNAATVAWPVPPAEFLAMVNLHTAEGFYADPGNGGNTDGVSWKMIGFEVRG